MNDIVTLDDFLESFDYSDKNYTSKNAYMAYKKACTYFSESMYSISQEYNIPYSTVHGWRKDSKEPFLAKQVRNLEEKNLLPEQL